MEKYCLDFPSIVYCKKRLHVSVIKRLFCLCLFLRAKRFTHKRIYYFFKKIFFNIIDETQRNRLKSDEWLFLTDNNSV